MADREQTAIDLLCGELQTSWSYCDPSCISCKFYHEESDMGARVSICVHGFGSSKESCGCYMTQREYLEFVRSGFANLKAENAKLRELVARYGEYTSQDRCDGCVCKSRCNDGDVDECWQLTEIRGLARELGIEVVDA